MISYRLGYILVGFTTTIVYFTLQAYTIYGGDAGDLASAIVTRGIPHPPGYPLYTLLGIVIDTVISQGTLAWRVGFLSSIPSAITCVLLFDLVCRITRRPLIGLITSLTYGFTYPVWLYASVVEVFALSNLFVVALIWSLYRLFQTRQRKFLLLSAFVLGLSLTHHHIIVFLIPALLYLVYKCCFRFRIRTFFLVLIVFFAGLSPMLYLFISASGNAAVNWMGEPTLSRFLSIVSRDVYGTFQAGRFVVHELPLRLLGITSFLEFLGRDFRLAGIVLMCVGWVYLFVQFRILWWMTTLAFLSYTFFLFYASFPLSQDFMLGTFERFLLPLYLVVSLFLAYGIKKIVDFLSVLIQKQSVFGARRSVMYTSIIFLILPLGLFLRNYPLIIILQSDTTAERLAYDILSSVEPNAILLLSTDTPLFDTQYIYYSENLWPQVKIIQFTKLFTPYYSAQIVSQYPQISILQPYSDPKTYYDDLLLSNSKHFPIYSKQAFETSVGDWVPWGLLFRFYPKGSKPNDEFIMAKNSSLWETYQNPMQGSLKRFRHLILSDVLRVYAIAHQEVAFYLAKSEFDKEAVGHLSQAISLYPSDSDSYTILAQLYSRLGQCEKADETIKLQALMTEEDDAIIYYLYAINEAVCRTDADRARNYQKLFEEAKRTKETKLNKLL